LVAEEELPGLALQYCLQHPAVASVVVGASSAAQIEQTVAAWQSVKELDIDYEMIANSVPVYHYQAHR
jgi:aryl-alcohol dehydrogenase-like predicted oxidoreductase